MPADPNPKYSFWETVGETFPIESSSKTKGFPSSSLSIIETCAAWALSVTAKLANAKFPNTRKMANVINHVLICFSASFTWQMYVKFELEVKKANN